jgi:LPXTG-motif cell wall-anchored protein
MKRFLIALFAVALVAGLPLVAQEYEEPDLTESELQTETDVDVDAEADLDVDLDTDDDFDTEDDLNTDDDFGDDELPATGSELPLAGALGLLTLAGAVALRTRS